MFFNRLLQNIIGNAECVGKGDGRRVCLDTDKHQTIGEDDQKSDKSGELWFAKTVSDIECRTAVELAVCFLFFVDLTDGRFNETGCCADEGEDPHPEYCSGTSHDDCDSHTGDISDTDPRTHADAEGLER